MYLFEATGAGFYLGLSHGSTSFVDGEFRPKPDSEIRKFMAWARGQLAEDIERYPELATQIQLNARRSHLGRAYENTTLLAKWYDAENFPSEDSFRSDAILFSSFLKKLYSAEDLGREPDTEPPEVASVNQIIRPVSERQRSAAQGRGLSTEERLVVEKYAMEEAKALLEADGFHVVDVSAKHSYDFRASRDENTIFVEIKGTTSLGEKVVLTANEVALHKEVYPDNALILVHSIDLERDTKPPRASGGEVVVHQPWKIEEAALAPISYTYNLDFND